MIYSNSILYSTLSILFEMLLYKINIFIIIVFVLVHELFN